MTKLRGNPWAVLVVVSLGFFMTPLDKTIPDVQTHFRRKTCQSPGALSGRSVGTRARSSPEAIASRHVLGRHNGQVGRLSQGHLPLVQIASIGRAL